MDYKQNLLRVSNLLGIPPAWLDTCIYIESKRNLQAVNTSSNATGLIQFMPATARDLGTTVEQIKQMNYDQQFDLIYLYFQKNLRGREVKRPFDIYLIIFYPAYFGHSLDTVFPQNVYNQNKGLDYDKNGQLSVRDIYYFFDSKMQYAYADFTTVVEEYNYILEKNVEEHPYIFITFCIVFVFFIAKFSKII